MSINARRLETTDPRLGRHVYHDSRSLNFPTGIVIDKSTWRDHTIRTYDPRPNPNQPNGCCTAVAKCVQFNSHGNRTKGVVLNMDDAQSLYHTETVIDPFPGTFPPDDTGSNGLASCKAAQQEWGAGEYRWILNGTDEVVQAIMLGYVVSVGTRWDNGMFNPDSDGRIHPGGSVAGGHQYSVRGWWNSRKWFKIRCWWGPGFRDVWIAQEDLQALLSDQGDAHIQSRR